MCISPESGHFFLNHMPGYEILTIIRRYNDSILFIHLIPRDQYYNLINFSPACMLQLNGK